MHTATDFAVLHAQRVVQAERAIARRLLVDECRILPPRRVRTAARTALRAVVQVMDRRRGRSPRSCAAPATSVPRGTMAA